MWWVRYPVQRGGTMSSRPWNIQWPEAYALPLWLYVAGWTCRRPVPFGPEAFTAKHSHGTTGDSQVSRTQQLVVVGAGSRVSEKERYELKQGIRSVHSC